jgi:succinate dehydrogenase flavin-adding protein (antitoxin of CptAB toxin-antitoxin module)
MKLTLKLTFPLLILSLLFTSFKKDDTKEIEDFSKKVLQSILKNDFNKYDKLIASKDNLYQLIDDEPSFNEDEKIKEKKMIEKIYEEKVYRKIADAFHEIKSKFTYLGINKKGFEIVKVEVEEKKIAWITKLDITVTFMHNAKTHTIVLDDCVMTKNGLKLLDNPIF